MDFIYLQAVALLIVLQEHISAQQIYNAILALLNAKLALQIKTVHLA